MLVDQPWQLRDAPVRAERLANRDSDSDGAKASAADDSDGKSSTDDASSANAAVSATRGRIDLLSSWAECTPTGLREGDLIDVRDTVGKPYPSPCCFNFKPYLQPIQSLFWIV